jgi:hypothetical protein
MSDADHNHIWQPNGIIKVKRVARSPCSTLDDYLWLDVMSVQVCGCGAVKRVKVGEENLRRRGDDYRRREGKRPLGRPLQ